MAEPLVLSLGAGVQSTTVALMSIEGQLPKLDHAIFADTGWEPRAVYKHLRWLAPQLEAAGIPLHIVSRGNIRADALDPAHRFASMPLFVRAPDGKKGMVRRQCTSEYKIKLIESKLREIVGIKPRQRPKGVLVEQWIGISLDEYQRMSDSSFPWIVKRYPLVDVKMTRWDCKRWLAERGLTAPRSACVGCPFRRNSEWRDLAPDEFADAVAFDKAIRSGNQGGTRKALLGEAYLHESLMPLDEVDLSTPEERGQGSLFGNECAGVCGV